MSLANRVRRGLRMYSGLADLVARERRALRTVDVPLSRRLSLWRSGYGSETGALLGLPRADQRLYVSDFERFVRSPLINFGGSNPILNDKLIFYYAMRTLSAPVPVVYAIVDRGVRWIDPPAEVAPSAGVAGLLEAGHEVVLKPVDGGAGRGVSTVASDGGTLYVNGRPCPAGNLDDLLVPGTLVQQRVHQGAYATAIAPASTNTLRVLTMWDYERDEPFVAVAVHRFGTTASVPVDSFSRGGIIVDVDVATGTFGRGLSPPRATELEWHTRHPDTGAQITGLTVPRWAAATDELLRLASRLPRIRYVGWDLLVTDDGFFVIEGNSFPEVAGHQVFTPLLADPRVRRFYRTHGVISR